MQIKNDENLADKIRHLLSEVNIKTYLYGILTIGVLIFILTQTKGSDKSYLIKNNAANIQCRDMYGNVVAIDSNDPSQGCVDIAAAAKDYGINLNSSNNNNSADTNYSNNTNSNLTQDLSQDLIMTNLYLNQNGITDDVTKGKIIANVVKRYGDEMNNDTYSISDLKITRDNSQSSYQDYYNDTIKALSEYTSEMKNFNSKYKNFDISNLKIMSNGSMPDKMTKEFNDLTTINNNLINNLISTPTTQDGAQYQLKVINTLNRENVFLNSLLLVGTDPMRYIALGGDNFIDNFKNDYSASINDFIGYFKSLNIKTN